MSQLRRSCVWTVASCLLALQASYARLHPVHVDDQSNCRECHADHVSGTCMHPALKRGCAACHTVSNRDGATYVELVSDTAVICRGCHQPAVLLHAHLPYTSGMCLRCHTPHSSENPHLLRAGVNDLCLTCHLQRPEKRPSSYLPTIELTVDRSVGHPYARHPVSGRSDPIRGGEMSCVSCHLPHGGTKLHHLKMGSEIPEDALNQNTETKDMCERCHFRLWGFGEERSGKHKKKRN